MCGEIMNVWSDIWREMRSRFPRHCDGAVNNTCKLYYESIGDISDASKYAAGVSSVFLGM